MPTIIFVGILTFMSRINFSQSRAEHEKFYKYFISFVLYKFYKKVQVGNDQEKAQSEKDSNSKN